MLTPFITKPSFRKNMLRDKICQFTTSSGIFWKGYSNSNSPLNTALVLCCYPQIQTVPFAHVTYSSVHCAIGQIMRPVWRRLERACEGKGKTGTEDKS